MSKQVHVNTPPREGRLAVGPASRAPSQSRELPGCCPSGEARQQRVEREE